MIIKIDNRETRRCCEAIKYYKSRYNIIIDKLPIGDYIFTNNKTSVVFEYKTFNDFRNSIHDGRLINQSIRQFLNFEYHFIIVESLSNNKKINLFDSLENCEAIANLNTFTTVLTCPTSETAFKMMEKQAEICLEQHPLTKKPYGKINNVAYNYLMLIKGIDKIKAQTICNKLQLKTFDDLNNISARQLLKVSGIGPLTAQRILNSIKIK